MNDAAFWNEIGNLYLKLDLFEEAISVYLKSIEINPDSGWTYSNLAYSYFKKGEYGRAVSLYRIGLPLLDNPKYQAITWNRLGDAFRALKDVENAIQAYKKADDLEISPSLSSALANKPRPNPEKVTQPFKPLPPAQVPQGQEKDNGNNEKALVKDTQPVNRPNPAGGALLREVLHAPVGKLPEINNRPDQLHNSLEYSRPQVKPLDPRQIAASNEAAVQLPDRSLPRTTYEIKKSNLVVIPPLEMEQPQEENGYTVGAEDQGPRSTTSQTEDTSPVQKVDLGSGWTPIEPEKVPAPDPNANPPRLTNNVNLEETLAKIHIYENITRSNPNNDRAWDTLGKLYKSLGRYEDAIDAYRQAIDKAPGREVYYYYLGLLYTVLKQDENAADAFKNVLKLNPDYILAHSALAGIYRRLGMESKANDHISIALPRMENESPYNLACFYAICGDTDKALGYLQTALKNKDTTIEWVKSDPDLELLHSDERYQSLIQQVDESRSSHSNDNYFSSELKGAKNKLLPLLNNSLTR